MSVNLQLSVKKVSVLRLPSGGMDRVTFELNGVADPCSPNESASLQVLVPQGYGALWVRATFGVEPEVNDFSKTRRLNKVNL